MFIGNFSNNFFFDLIMTSTSQAGRVLVFYQKNLTNIFIILNKDGGFLLIGLDNNQFSLSHLAFRDIFSLRVLS